MVPTAPKACIICGLKREERVAKVDYEVEDSFGECFSLEESGLIKVTLLAVPRTRMASIEYTFHWHDTASCQCEDISTGIAAQGRVTESAKYVPYHRLDDFEVHPWLVTYAASGIVAPLDGTNGEPI
ncbi:hypothetical protein NM208_g16619 [Fusarium decemcellulare]|uniref:Uncharacterized protein n=1 Tax=Fusarium decemcellulare TaxID=57161 RepID=A0ACC1RB26_9HYPO|nr:hypothetical protein NM208_g16619 [Fusarium decemcellulare]